MLERLCQPLDASEEAGATEIASACNEHSVFVSGDCPLADHEWGVESWSGKDGMARVFPPCAVAEGDFHGAVGIGLGRDRDEGFLAVGAGVDRCTIDAGFPEGRVCREDGTEGGAAF